MGQLSETRGTADRGDAHVTPATLAIPSMGHFMGVRDTREVSQIQPSGARGILISNSRMRKEVRK
jgi:hypothetical protein